MVSRVLSFLCIVIILISQSNAQPNFLYYFCVDAHANGNYTANSTYQSNLNTLLSNFSSNTQIDYGFYNFSYGQDNDKVNAIGLCRGDAKPNDCLSCLNDSRILLTKLCPNQKQAIGWYDNCMLRYSNRSIFNTMENLPALQMCNPGNATDIGQFNQVLRNLLESLISTAQSGNSKRKFAAANVKGPGFQTIYGLVQCTPDLSKQDCDDCLVQAISGIPQYCDGRKGGRILVPSCNFRYEIYPFYDLTNVATPPTPTAFAPRPSSTDVVSTEGKSNTSRTVIIAVVVPITALVILVIPICIYLRRRMPRRRVEGLTGLNSMPVKVEDSDEIRSSETLQLDFATVVAATNNFSDAYKLGQGGFGPVYKGRLSNGQEVAVKRLSRNSVQGDLEFKNEVLLVAKLQHRNLVRLLGFSSERKERLLVYEFVPNKSLDFFIFDQIKRAQLDWERRYKIIGGIVRGLLYLHEDSRLRIIHRDLKASNILLDVEMNPKISDFGMARLFAVDQTQSNTSRIVGTYFGVPVLEIISGQKNSGVRRREKAEDLISFAWKSWREGIASNIVDPTIVNGSQNEIMRCIHIGLLCVQENVANRPTMASVVLMLNSHSVTLPLPSQPALLINNRSLSDIHSEEYNSKAISSSESGDQYVQASVNEASITQPFPR